MRTDDLIRTLVSDRHPLPAAVSQRAVPALIAGVAVSALGFVMLLGPRADFADAAATLRFNLKFVVTLLLFATATALALRMVRPGARLRYAGAALLAAPSLLLAAAAIELALLPPDRWVAAAIGSNARVCLTAVPLMAVPILAGAVYALRSGAPVHPVMTGIVAGLLSAGAAAALYAMHCTDDSPLFVAVWYASATGIVAMLGALAGWLCLRW